MEVSNPPVVPRPASTVVLIRRTPELEVLVGLRPPGGPFGGIWAFPGGAVDEADHDVDRFGFDDPWRAAALRETAEEVGIFLTDPVDATLDVSVSGDVVEIVRAAGARFNPSRLRFLSNWLTPTYVPRRFDTRFFLGEVDIDVTPKAMTSEFEAVEWVEPALAVEQGTRGLREMMRPTAWHIERLAETSDPWLIDHHPRLMPGDQDDLVAGMTDEGQT